MFKSCVCPANINIVIKITNKNLEALSMARRAHVLTSRSAKLNPFL